MNKDKHIVILGGGIAGLAAGYFLSERHQVTVLERAPTIGGMCGSFNHLNFTLDYGAHKLYSILPGILDEIRGVMNGRLVQLKKQNRIFLNGQLIDYPLKMSNLLSVLGPIKFIELAFGYAWQLLKGFVLKKPALSYEDFMTQRFGKPAYELVFGPLAEKVWGNPAQLHPDMARVRVPESGGLSVIFKLLGLKKDTKDTNAEFFYYPKKGFGDFPQALKEEIEKRGGKVLTNAEIDAIDLKAEQIQSIAVRINGSKEVLKCDGVVSSIAPGPLLRYLQPHNQQLSNQTNHLRFRHLILLYLFVKRPLILKDQWIFFPERKFTFGRLFEQKQMFEELGPKDQTVLCCDFTCEKTNEFWTKSDQEIANTCAAQLEEAGFIKKGEVFAYLVKRHENFYPCYDLDYEKKINMATAELRKVKNLLLTGRIGMFNYNNSDHCFDMGRFISQEIDENRDFSQIWQRLEERVRNYKIVD